jgi:TolB protein
MIGLLPLVTLALSAQPAPNPIVYAHRGEIVRTDASGRALRLTRNRVEDYLPAWSPDRRRIAFVRNRRGAQNIYVMRADGTRVRRLTGTRRPNPSRAQLYPSWSPDGQRLAYSAGREGREPEIHVMRPDGSRRRRLTRTRAATANLHPSFSPDGRHIVFSSTRTGFFNSEIFRIRASDGGGLTRLTFAGTGGDGDPGDDVMPEYSPDGSRIVFVSDRGGTLQAWTMAADGSDVRQVTDHPGSDVAFPRWSRDGQSLLYATSPPEGAAELFRIAADGTERTRLRRGNHGDW